MNIGRDIQGKPSDIRQGTGFLNAIKITIILGQCAGLNPVMGILRSPTNMIRFQFLSWKSFHSLVLLTYQILGIIFCIYEMCTNHVTTIILELLTFYTATCITTIMFYRIAKRWSYIIHVITQSHLEEYADPRVKIRCDVTAITLFISVLIEHTLSQIATYASIFECTRENLQSIYKIMLDANYFWLLDSGLPYSLPLVILIQVFNVMTMINWYYTNIFIICICIYLTSIFDEIHEKIISAQEEHFQPWFWSSLREEYSRATRLVRLFDDLISGVVFVSFANSLSVICLQLYNVLQHGLTRKQQASIKECPNFQTGPFFGYEYSIYIAFSIFMMICRFLAMALIASRVHSAAVQPTTALYRVPSQFYCAEIQRFIEQIHCDEVALSGLNFFHITKSLILSVAGTIVTYELVLLQIGGN